MPNQLLSARQLAAAWDRLHITQDNMYSAKWPFHVVNYDTLLAVYYQFVTTIPFENLDFHRRKPFVMHPAALFNKMILRKEGGICYELHGLFALLLESLGFNVSLVPVYVNRNRDSDPLVPDFFQNSTHANTFVSFSDEKGCSRRFVCEIGIGSVSRPLDLELGTEQTAYDGQKYRYRQLDEEWVVLEIWHTRLEHWVIRYRVPTKDFDAENKGTFKPYPFPEAFFSGLVAASQPGGNHQSYVMAYMLRSEDPHWNLLSPPPSITMCSLTDGLYAETCRTFGQATTRTERPIETSSEYFDLLWRVFGLKAEDLRWPLDMALILEKDKTLKPSPRWPVLTLDGVEKAHKAFVEDPQLPPHEAKSESLGAVAGESELVALGAIDATSQSFEVSNGIEEHNKRQKVGS